MSPINATSSGGANRSSNFPHRVLEPETILWIASVGIILVVLVAVLFGVIVVQRAQKDEPADEPLISIGKILLALGVFAATIISFAVVTDGWMDQEEMYELDMGIYEFFSALQIPIAVAVMQVITWFGSTQAAIATLVILTIYFWTHGARHQLMNLFIVFIPGSAALWLLKAIFGRDRPGDPLAPTAGHSFPSGHSFTAMIIYGFLIYLVWVETKDDVFRVIITVFLTLIILSVAASRIILNVHWASDVIGGLMFGLAWLVSSLMISSIAGRVIVQRRATLHQI